MTLLTYLSNLIIPMITFYIVLHGICAKISVYDLFLEGAKDGMKTVVTIMPTMIGLMIGVGILRASGFMDCLGSALHQFLALFHIQIQPQLMPLILVKMFSSSAATSLVLDIFKTFGPDSKTGLVTSLIMSSTETIFYTMNVYFLAAKVKKTRYTIPGALLASLAGIIASFYIVSIL